MAHLIWSSDLDTGIAEIDRQHQRIVEYINNLYDQRRNPDRAALAQVIADTVEYTQSHFAFEEHLLEQAGYPFTDLHKKVHQLFIRRLGAIKARFEAGENVADELHQMLSRWLFSHIRTEDHGYCTAVKAYLHKRAEQSHWPEDTEFETLLAKNDLPELKKGWLQRLLGR